VLSEFGYFIDDEVTSLRNSVENEQGQATQIYGAVKGRVDIT